MSRLTVAALIFGLGAVVALVAWLGFGTVAVAFAELGWGILLMVPFYALCLLVSTASWRMIFVSGQAPNFGTALLGLWIGTSVNVLLPVATIGGEFAKARILTRYGMVGIDAGGSVVVDTTVQALSLVLWGLIGIGILLGTSVGTAPYVALLASLLMFGLAMAALIGMQLVGMFAFLARVSSRLSSVMSIHGVPQVAANLDANIRTLYRQPWRIAGATGMRLLARISMVGEVWIAAALMGYGITVWDAIMLKSLSMALRGAAFFVPAGLGIQEGAFILVGTLAGLPPELTLTLSLATRAREIISSIPALFVWRKIEGAALATLLLHRDKVSDT